jgi:hypothetical protein
MTFTADQLGNGAKELLDEVATGKVTGEEEIWSHTDLWGTHIVAMWGEAAVFRRAGGRRPRSTGIVAMDRVKVTLDSLVGNEWARRQPTRVPLRSTPAGGTPITYP